MVNLSISISAILRTSVLQECRPRRDRILIKFEFVPERRQDVCERLLLYVADEVGVLAVLLDDLVLACAETRRGRHLVPVRTVVAEEAGEGRCERCARWRVQSGGG